MWRHTPQISENDVTKQEYTHVCGQTITDCDLITNKKKNVL
jgi:hypothetical protein